MSPRLAVALAIVAVCSAGAVGQSGAPADPPLATTLSDTSIPFTVVQPGRAVLSRGPVTAVVVDNGAHGDDHRSGYNGVAELRHRERASNVFVPQYAGLNLEHIHDGSSRLVDRDIYFEPRRYPMQLRRIGEHVVELYQRPTPTWHVESCTRFAMLPDGVIEMTFHARPTRAVFKHEYVGFFWASYIDRPESKAIHFLGASDNDPNRRWLEVISPRHGFASTHRGYHDDRAFVHDEVLPERSLIFAYSPYRFAEPFYYGVSHGMALLYVFRPADVVRMTQSPTGGGATNPAWDFQWFVDKPEVGRVYGMQMRAIYTPLVDRDELATLARRHIKEMTQAKD